MLWPGNVYTNNSVHIRGVVDDRTGDAGSSSDKQLYVKYKLSSSNYRIIGCLQCHKEFVVTNAYPPVVVHPDQKTSVEVAPEIPKNIGRVLFEAKQVHTMGAETASLLAARTALIRMQREQQCNGIDELATRGVITRFLADQAHEIRLWANALGHEDVSPDIPTQEDVGQLLMFLDLLFDTIYVQPVRLRQLQTKRASTLNAGEKKS